MVIEWVGSPRIDCVENFRIFVVFLNISAVAWFVESRRISSSFSRDLKIKLSQRQGQEVPNNSLDLLERPWTSTVRELVPRIPG